MARIWLGIVEGAIMLINNLLHLLVEMTRLKTFQFYSFFRLKNINN
jgi:hypothetical protein